MIEGYKELAAAIIAAAAKDYTNAIINGRRKKINEGHEFFESSYFQILAQDVTAETLMKKCRAVGLEVRRFEIRLLNAQGNADAVKQLVGEMSDSALVFARNHLRKNAAVLRGTRKIMAKEAKKRGLVKSNYDLSYYREV